MLGVIAAEPTLYNLWRWHPIVLPGENENKIATALIGACISPMKASGIHHLEICFDFSRHEMIPETEAYYQQYNAWYAQHGIVKLDEYVYIPHSAP
jgi:hypothetical protein